MDPIQPSTMRNAALAVIAFVALSLTLFLHPREDGVRSRITTSLRLVNDDGYEYDNDTTSKVPPERQQPHLITDFSNDDGYEYDNDTTSKVPPERQQPHPITDFSNDDGYEYDNDTTDTKVPLKHHQQSNPNDFCSLVDTKFPEVPSQWWTTHFDDILTASRNPQDSNFAYKNWTTSLLASISPEILQLGIRARPTGPALDRVASIIHKRITFPQSFPPLQIAVVGGSVTRGQGCHVPVLEGTRRMSATTCAWPTRLEHLINTLAGMELVKIHNLAVSATNLKFGTPLVKYRLYPDELLQNGPDVIISSYSTNEQALHVDTTISPQYANECRSRIQEFIHAASGGSNGCNESPLIVFVDDYLGNRQDVILGETTFNKVTTELAEWYSHVMHVSYADVVRRFLYADTSESTFSSPWPLETSGKYRGQPKVDVHFGMGGHAVTSWSILFAFLDVARTYCDSSKFKQEMKRRGHEGVFSKQVEGLVKNVPPPDLSPSLLLQHVSEKWNANAARRQLQCNEIDEANTASDYESPCIFAFLAGPDATVRNEKQLEQYLRPYIIKSNGGWQPKMEYGSGRSVEKPGLVATSKNASMTLHFENIQQNVQVLNVQRIKSYGEKWADSKARFTVEIQRHSLNATRHWHKRQFDVSGYQDFESSVSFPFEYDLKNHKASKGSNITLTIDLVGGTTFKILGLMLCNN